MEAMNMKTPTVTQASMQLDSVIYVTREEDNDEENTLNTNMKNRDSGSEKWYVHCI